MREVEGFKSSEAWELGNLGTLDLRIVSFMSHSKNCSKSHSESHLEGGGVVCDG